ncbi:MAG: hypothetical protein IJE63_03635, partial [Clostridia bacterium]|nr:hypothetical protein [Clostridia bacterium]
MNVEDLLEKIEEVLDNGQKVAFSSKIVVNIEEIRNCVDEIRANMPEEVRQARNIVSDRNTIIGEANAQAEDTVTKANEKARETVNKANAKAKEYILTSEERAKSTVAQAEERAGVIVAEADARAQQMVEESEIAARAKQYCDDMLQKAKAQA